LQGPTGATGSGGATGATGATGAAPLTIVGSFFSSAAGTTVALNANAPLTTAGGGNTAGAFSLASNTVTVVNAGTYLIWYQAAIAASNAAVFQLFVNGAGVAGTLGVSQNPASSVHQLVGAATVTLAANATVNVRNVSTTTDTLASAVDGATPTSVSLTLVRIG